MNVREAVYTEETCLQQWEPASVKDDFEEVIPIQSACIKLRDGYVDLDGS